MDNKIDLLPLIPKNNQHDNHDVSHVIREVFQEVLGKPEFSMNVAENTGKYNIENPYLRNNGGKVITAYDKAKLSMEDIGFVEDNLMVEQGKCYRNQDVVAKDYILNEHAKLKQNGMLVDFDLKDGAEKYGLIQKINVLPTRPEREIDFRINSNPHRCLGPCDRQLESTNPKRKRPRKQTQNQEPQREILFIAEPDEVIFDEYKTGVIYKKQFKLRNISKTIQAFIPRFPPKISFFRIELQSGCSRVPPGMCATYLVTYQTDVYENVEEIIVFNTYTGRNVEVKLKSYRRPPLLIAYVIKSFQHFVSKCHVLYGSDGYSTDRCAVLNATIDCGSCLLGQELRISLVLKNVGNTGRFFILSEEDWFFADVLAMNTDMKLMLGPFYIYPAYFEIEKHEYIRIDLKFLPIEFGLAVEKFFILSDNTAMEELEIVGDGILFQKNTITIEVKSLPEDTDMLAIESKYYMYFKESIPLQKQIRKITIHNNSTISVRYKWTINENVCHTSNSKLKNMSSSWVEISDASGILPGESTTDFTLTLECKTEEPGMYNTGANFYALDIPEVSLVDKTFTAMDKCEKSETNHRTCELLNVLIGEIHLNCKVVPIKIIFDPEHILIPYTVRHRDVFKHTVQIYSYASVSVDCEWRVPHYVEVNPSKFSLQSKTTFLCDVYIRIVTPNSFEDKLFFIVNGGIYQKIYHIKAKLVQPDAHFSTNVLDFGKIHQASPHVPGKKIHVHNLGPVPLCWKMLEITYDFEKKDFHQLDASKHISATIGKLKPNESCELTYTIDNNLAHYHWISLLLLLSCYPIVEAISVCLVVYESVAPTVMIHTGASHHPLIFPRKLLYVGCTTYYRLCLYNYGELLPNTFTWFKPTGPQADSIIINFSPKSGIIPPQKCVHITVIITPQEAGIFDQIEVPCFIGNVDTPIMLMVICVVSNICLNFHLPSNEGRYEKVFWPPDIIEMFERFSTDSGLEEATSFAEEAKSEANTEANELKEDYDGPSIKISLKSKSIQSLLSASKNSLTQGSGSSQLIYPPDGDSLPSTEASTASEDSVQSTSSRTPCTTGPLKTCFGSAFILQEHVLEYNNVPLRTPVKKTIIIENVTPVLGKFNIEITNFCEKEEEENVLDHILDKLKIKQKDEWECTINEKYGIVVKSTPLAGTLLSYQSVEVDIWIYANTWGVYAEEMMIKVNEIYPFCFNLLIEVIGTPIEFPVALHSINSEHIMRFGNLPYLSEPFQRKLKITNSSSIPICLVWHVFISQHYNNFKKDPFNVLVETYDMSTNVSDKNCDVTELLITSKYYGKEDWKIFQINPRVININPKTTATVDVILNSKYFTPQFTKTEIEACLLGYLHLAEEFTGQPSVFTRQTGICVAPAKAKLLATLELPLLKLELIKGETRIGVYANDIIDSQEVQFERMLIFQNNDTAPATVYMHILNPFEVISLRTAQTNTEKNPKAAIVQPGECLEVLLECTIDAEQVLQFSDMVFNEKSAIFTESVNFRENSVTIQRHLNIHQHGLEKQITALELVIYYPKLQVSHNVIDFGFVFIGNTKKMLLTLKNLSGAHLPYYVHKLTTSDAMVIKPDNGVIPKARGLTPSTVTLSLYFMPSECNHYQEVVRILTNIPLCSHNITLSGIGVANEKFYVEGT